MPRYRVSKRKTKHEEKEEKGDYYRSEISRGAFSRTITLPDNVDSEGAKATFENGMLEMTLPKTGKARRHTITIEKQISAACLGTRAWKPSRPARASAGHRAAFCRILRLRPAAAKARPYPAACRGSVYELVVGRQRTTNSVYQRVRVS